jgi:thiamine-phosphate pyrophosphorylase
MKFNPAMLHVYLVGGTQDVNHDPALFLQKVETAMQAGITAFQYREKGSSTLTAAEKLAMAKTLRQLTRHYHLPLFIDDDEQLALTVGADGVHVGQKDQRIEEVIARAAGRLIIGYSCNTPAEIKKANQLSAVDYVGTGPVFPTVSKADADPALGLEKLRQLNAASVHPMVAIGGIGLDNMEATLESGVAGLSVISMVLGSKDSATVVQKMRQLYS